MRKQALRREYRSQVASLCIFGPVLLIAISCSESQRGPAKSAAARTGDAMLGGDRWEDARTLLAGGLVGSKHDFSRDGENPRDLCLTCHTPHRVGAPVALLDRFPRPARAAALRQAFGDELSAASLLCLSCHDGVTAKDVFTSSHALQWTGQLGSMQLGSRPLSSHPVGAEYPYTRPTYRTLAEVQVDGRVKLPEGRVQCTSCHDPHNTERHPAMLVKSNARSALCLSCHKL